MALWSYFNSSRYLNISKPEVPVCYLNRHEDKRNLLRLINSRLLILPQVELTLATTTHTHTHTDNAPSLYVHLLLSDLASLSVQQYEVRGEDSPPGGRRRSSQHYKDQGQRRRVRSNMHLKPSALSCRPTPAAFKTQSVSLFKPLCPVC